MDATRELQEEEACPRAKWVLYTVVQEIDLDLFGLTAIGAWFQHWNHFLVNQTSELSIAINRTETLHTISTCIWCSEQFVAVATHLIGCQIIGFALVRAEETQNIFNALGMNA